LNHNLQGPGHSAQSAVAKLAQSANCDHVDSCHAESLEVPESHATRQGCIDVTESGDEPSPCFARLETGPTTVSGQRNHWMTTWAMMPAILAWRGNGQKRDCNWQVALQTMPPSMPA